MLVNRMKKSLKKNRLIKLFYESIFQRPIYNLFNSCYKKRVLFSYSTYHFNTKDYSSHSNYQESKSIAKIFDYLGYQVDVVNNDREYKGDFMPYDIIFGEGVPMYQAIEMNVQGKVVYYGTGSHPWHCTNSSLNRLVGFYNSYQHLALSSTRASEYCWGLAASLADVVICIGNQTTKKTFLEHGAKKVYTIDPSFIQRHDSHKILALKNMDNARKKVLWFGSYGLLHKGLDIAIEAFRQRPDWTLHVCGYTEAEKELINVIEPPSNVIIHGFLDVYSDDFKKLAIECGFVILPSCSEGTATAVLTAVGNGSMVPIVTSECGFDIDNFGFSIQLNANSVVNTIDEIDELSTEYLYSIAKEAHSKISERYTLYNFELNMQSYINDIISK